MRSIATGEAFALMKKGVVYLDVRTEQEFEAGHPEGAWNLSVADPDFAVVAFACFDAAAPIIVGCRSGVRSVVAAEMLEREGSAEVYSRRAGWDGARDAFGRVTEIGWRKTGLPCGSGPSPDRGSEALRARRAPAR